jgi:hypothetical protein
MRRPWLQMAHGQDAEMDLIERCRIQDPIDRSSVDASSAGTPRGSAPDLEADREH